LPKYSTDIADAWELVEAMRQGGRGDSLIGTRVVDFVDALHSLLIDNWRTFSEYDVWHQIDALAICRAFLLARGVTELEVE